MKQKINLELKYRCSNFVYIRKVLKEIGAKKIIVKQQKDYFFNLPLDNKKIPARLKLRVENGKQTLVYYRRPDFSKTSDTPADVTILAVKDPKLLNFLSKALGLKVVVEKRRELWRKENTVFNLDRVKNIGNIFEVEVWTTPRTIKADKKKFADYRKKLLPYLNKIVSGSNENLISKLKYR